MKQTDRFFLGVESSITGKAWRDRLADRQAGIAIAQRHDLPEIIGRVLAARGVSVDEARDFLNPTLRRLLPDPSSLVDMAKAATRIARAIAAGETIAIFGDYDVDGATSSALLKRFLRAVGSDAMIYIPDRLSEGYGPNEGAFRQLADRGAGLVVTVDCGVSAHDPIDAARALGLEVVVIDHHQAGEHLPNAQAVVNPNRQDDLSGLGYLAAVGVTFLLVVAVNRLLREEGRYTDDVREPDLLELLDLVALGTVCDVVPLVGLNRALVAQGLKVMGRRGNIGLAALGEAARLARRPDTFSLGFLMGPRINAAGRMGNAGLGAELLSTQDSDRARSIAAELEKLNGLRRDEEAAVLDAALMQAERSLGHDLAPPAVVVAGDGWHPGVIGIVAGRLKEQFNRPAVVVAFDKTGRGTGSGRSIAGVDLGSAVRAAAEAGVLVRGGGHAMAAGLTIERARIGDFRAFLEETLAIDVGEATALPGLSVDGAMSAGGATPDFIRLLEDAGPYGTGNPRPRFAFPAHRISYCELVGTDHVRCTIQGGDGARLKAIAFRAAGSPLGAAMLKRDGVPVHIAGHLSLNEWGGKVSAQLIVEDIAAVR